MRILLILTLITCLSLPLYAENLLPKLNFNGSVYHLQYSDKNKQTGGFINEYYKGAESYNNWTELVAIHYFPNIYSPIEQAKLFRKALGEIYCPSALEVFDDDNKAMLDFVLINDKKLPIIIEFNVFKYEKSDIAGTVAYQYAKRYIINNPLEINKVKKELNKNRLKYIKKVLSTNIPEVITELIDKGQYVVNNQDNIDINDVSIIENEKKDIILTPEIVNEKIEDANTENLENNSEQKEAFATTKNVIEQQEENIDETIIKP